MCAETSELVIENARIETTEGLFDIIIHNGLISEIQTHPAEKPQNAQLISADGMMVFPPFIDAHEHLDCAFMLGKENQSGTLGEAIELYSSEKRDRPFQKVRLHAEQAITEALHNGTCVIRSHTDLDSIVGEKHLQALVELREAYRGVVDIQIVACMQYSLREQPDAERILRFALNHGADLVGGIPEIEPTPEESLQHLQMVFRVAKEFDVDIDCHIDQTTDPNVRNLETLADLTVEQRYFGRVTAGHTCALSMYEDRYAQNVIGKVRGAGINIITNPLTNLYLQGRTDGTPTLRGITRVKELLDAGVNVACGLDDTRNMFMPFGRMNMLEAAMFVSLSAHLTTPDELLQVLKMPTHNAAKVLGIEEYGIEVGMPADLVVLPVTNKIDALRLQPLPRFVIRRGRIVAENNVEKDTYV